jgi:hypothetical protein
LVRAFTLVLLLASLWGIINQSREMNRSVYVAIGVAGPVQEGQHEGAVRYFLPFREQESGEEMNFLLLNNSPVLNYLVASPPTHTIALQYWPDDMSIKALNLLVPGVDPIEHQITRSMLLLSASALGLLASLVLLLPDLFGRYFFGYRRRSRQG